MHLEYLLQFEYRILQLNPNYIIPKAFNLDVQKRVAEAVKEAAIKSVERM